MDPDRQQQIKKFRREFDRQHRTDASSLTLDLIQSEKKHECSSNSNSVSAMSSDDESNPLFSSEQFKGGSLQNNKFLSNS